MKKKKNSAKLTIKDLKKFKGGRLNAGEEWTSTDESDGTKQTWGAKCGVAKASVVTTKR